MKVIVLDLIKRATWKFIAECVVYVRRNVIVPYKNNYSFFNWRPFVSGLFTRCFRLNVRTYEKRKYLFIKLDISRPEYEIC